MVIAVADVTPGWHPQTGKLIAIGCTVRYGKNGEQLSDVPRFSQTAYAVYDPKTGRWSKWQVLELPPRRQVQHGPQRLRPMAGPARTAPCWCRSTSAKAPNVPASVTVLHCAFDGQKLTYLKHGDELSLNVVRGLCEPSIVAFRGRYYLTIRNDIKGYVTVSDDGLHYQPIKPWTFDDGSELGSYNTQQHWLAHSDGLFLGLHAARGQQRPHSTQPGPDLPGPGRSGAAVRDPQDREADHPRARGDAGQLRRGSRSRRRVLGDRRRVHGQRPAQPAGRQRQRVRRPRDLVEAQ